MTFVDYVTPVPADWLNNVNAYVNAVHTNISVVNSIASLRLLSKLTNTQSLVTGYYTQSDGGGGIYNFIASDTTSADNGGTIIVASDGGRWYLQNTGTVSVKQFGAKGDNTTNDAAAFQNAINSGATRIHVPASQYRINTALNFTNRSTALVIYGDGAYYANNGGTVIHFFTGTWMADMTGCQFLHLEHMRWVSDGTVGSATMGCLYARSTLIGFAILNSMFKMIIELPSSTGSTAGSVALADNCMENFIADGCWFLADTPYATTLANELSFASIYATLANTTFSNTDKSFRQCVFLARGGAANLLVGMADSTFDQCNWTLFGFLGGAIPSAIIMESSLQGYQNCENIRFTGDFESFPAICDCTGNTADLNFDVTTSGLTTGNFILMFNSTTHDGFRLKVNRINGPVGTVVLASGPGVTINNAEIFLAVGQILADSNITLQGGTVYGGGNDLANAANLTVNSASSFTASYFNSKITGQVAWTPGAVPANSTVVTLLGVPGAALNSSVRVMPPYSIPFCIASAFVTSPGSVELMLSNVNGSASTAFGSGLWTVEVTKIHG